MAPKVLVGWLSVRSKRGELWVLSMKTWCWSKAFRDFDGRIAQSHDRIVNSRALLSPPTNFGKLDEKQKNSATTFLFLDLITNVKLNNT